MNTTDWSAVLAGAIVGLGLNFLLNLFSLSVGLAVFSSTDAGLAELSPLGFTGFLLVGVAAMFSAGWTTGVLSSVPTRGRKWGFLYGFITWCLSLIVTTVLLTNMIQFAAFHTNFTSQPDTVGIRITNDKPFSTESKTSKNKALTQVLDLEKDKKIITLTSFTTLAIFLSGAIACCFGGFVGFSQQIKRKK